jgi:hypothetical protein
MKNSSFKLHQRIKLRKIFKVIFEGRKNCNSQNGHYAELLGFGLCPSFGIYAAQNATFQKLDQFQSSDECETLNWIPYKKLPSINEHPMSKTSHVMTDSRSVSQYVLVSSSLWSV